MRQKGTICHAMAAVNFNMSRFVTAWSVTIGMPSDPPATGNVFPTRPITEAASGGKPNPIMMAAHTATGVPRPAAPSKKALKAKAMSRICRRRSAATAVRLSRRILNNPFSSVRRNRKSALSTIQPTGNNP